MAKGIIVLRKAGQELPDDFLDRIVKAKPRCMGVAIADPDKGMSVSHVPGMVEAKDIKQVLDAYKGQVLLHFGEYPQTYDKDDVQPMVLHFGDEAMEEPSIVVALEGEFIANTTDSSHMDSYHVAYDYLAPKIEEMFDMCGKDIEKLLIAVRAKSFEKDLCSQIKSTGSAVFMGADGNAWTIMQNKKDYLQTDWGFTSNSLGWKAKTEVDEDNKSERMPDWKAKLLSLKDKASTAVKADETKQEPAKKDPKDFPDKKVVEGVDGPRRSKVPDNVLRGKLRDIKKYLKNVAVGGIPQEVEIDARGNLVTDKAQVDWANLYIITHSDNDAWKAAQGKKPEEHTVDQKPKSLQERVAAKKAAEAAAESKVDTSGTGVTVKEFVPVIPPDQKGALENRILEWMDADGNKMKVAPQALQGLEGKFAPFTESLGIDMDVVNSWSINQLWELVQDYQESACTLLIQLLNDRKKKAEAPKEEPAKKPLTLAERIAAKKAASA